MSDFTDSIRNKNKDLLETDGITDEEIETAGEDSLTTIFNRVGEVYVVPIAEEDLPADLILCRKLLTCATLIMDHYPERPDAVKVAEKYQNEAFGNLKGIVETKKRRFADLEKQKIAAIQENKLTSYSDDYDSYRETYRENLNSKYR
jgi:hypothetical protein